MLITRYCLRLLLGPCSAAILLLFSRSSAEELKRSIDGAKELSRSYIVLFRLSTDLDWGDWQNLIVTRVHFVLR